MDKAKIVDDFKGRVKDTAWTRWLRFGLVTAVFIAWVIWLQSWWVSLFLILLFDIYITQYIPLGWWRKSKSAAVRAVMSWVDAIVYALILVYFVFTYVGQNYQIPSSSLEKSLLVGDYLWVNKMAYGPRVPNTPLHFPLVQNTLPVLGTKSYIEWPQWSYHRLKGWGNVKHGDIVVFNFPAGDTVALKAQNPDYYTLCRMFGHTVVNSNTERFGEIIYRPVDRRENYVKRAVGLPGDTLQIIGGDIYINGKEQTMPANAQFNYFFQLKPGQRMSEDDWAALGVAVDDRHQVQVSPLDHDGVVANGFTVLDNGTVPPIYASPLTQAAVQQLEKGGHLTRIMRIQPEAGDYLYPYDLALAEGWTRADYGPIWIPKKGATITLNADTWQLYGRAIRNYEHNDAELRGNKVYINDRAEIHYTFLMDYYFMMGDNRDNSLDSRYWGFVPEDHIVGRPEVVLISFDKDKSLFDGAIRANRILRSANPTGTY